MHFAHDAEQAQAFTQSALNLMAERSIPSTPTNFAIWYAYFSGQNPNLVETLDALLAEDRPFTHQLGHQLFERYFGFDQESKEVRKTSDQIQSTVDQVVTMLGDAGKQTSDYYGKLESASGYLTARLSSEDLEKLVKGMLGETKRVVEKSKALEGRLKSSSQEIAQLQRHLDEVRQEALTDALTGIGNRKYFDTCLAEEVEKASQNGESLCLLMADIDYFKKFNDSYGHRIGDKALKIVASVLKDGVKGRDRPARYGGEEFAVILPNTPLDAAITVANHLRETLSGHELKSKNSGRSLGKVTLSMGAARYRVGEPLEAFVQRADAALYQAKAKGRNRVVSETALPEPVSLAS